MGHPPTGKVAMTRAERQRRYWLKNGTAKPAPKPGADAALQKELAQAKARIAELENAAGVAAAKIAASKAELHDILRACFASRERKPAKPKIEKPPLPPDEKRDRQIKGLKTANKNIRAELHHLREWCKTTGIPERGGMSVKTHNTIMMPLHSDHRKHLTRDELDAKLDAACEAMTAWGDGLKRR
jgi:hypothetical protein